jgi:1-acyl-sn-glycerol-3-phosphate acyltransferase
MILGDPDKRPVIDNIQINYAEGRLNDKVEVNDPVVTSKKSRVDIVERHLRYMRTTRYAVKNLLARQFVTIFEEWINRHTTYVGLEKVRNISTGAIVTSNHFNQLENMTVFTAMRKAGHRRTYAVSEETNFDMSGIIGFFLRNFDTIPITKDHHYLATEFPAIIDQLLAKGRFILIYPEEQMWFNYRRPRPEKHGAFDFAAAANVPVIPCFVEMVDTGKPEPHNEQFNIVHYVMHVLDPIYPDPKLSVAENSKRMRALDHQQKVEAYESIYGRAIDAPFSQQDIAGYRLPVKTEAQVRAMIDQRKHAVAAAESEAREDTGADSDSK